jgi:hypothetical protein
VELKVYLVENSGDYSGDNTGKTGAKPDASTRGGSTPYSTDTASLQLTVTAVNDAPYWNDNALSTDSAGKFLFFDGILADGQQPTNAGKTVSDALRGNGVYAFLDDRDEVPGGSHADTLQGILITGIVGPSDLGVWQYSTDNGGTWQSISGVSEGNALFLSAGTLLRFQYSGEIPAVDAQVCLSVALVDSSGASNSLFDGGPPITGDSYNISNAANRGGVTAISEESVDLRVVITSPNNEPPVAEDDLFELDASTDTVARGNLLDNDWDWDNPHDQLEMAGFTIDGKPGVFGDTYELTYGKLVINADGTYLYTLYGDADDPDKAAATRDALAALPKGQSLTEPADIQYWIKDGGLKTYGAGGVAQYDGNSAYSALPATLTLQIMRSEYPDDAPSDIIVTTQQEHSTASHHIEGKKDYPAPGIHLKDLEVQKPVVTNVGTAQTAVFHSFGQGISDVLGSSREADKFLPPGGADQWHRGLYSEAGASMLLAGRPAIAGLEVGKDNAVRLPASLFYYSDQKGKLAYSAVIANGEPLPPWLAFDASSLTFTGKPPTDEAGAVELVVIARSDSGHEARAKVTLHLHDPEKADGAEKLTPDSPGKEGAEDNEAKRDLGAENGPPGLSYQIGAYGQAGILKTAQHLLQSLQLL